MVIASSPTLAEPKRQRIAAAKPIEEVAAPRRRPKPIRELSLDPRMWVEAHRPRDDDERTPWRPRMMIGPMKSLSGGEGGGRMLGFKLRF